ncbi:MAG: aldehyde ferredoxin oxidoreductase family protein [Spirochaetota bacterium]
MHGYFGKILEVDLGGGSCTERELAPEDARRYIGGSGLAACLVYRETFGGDRSVGARSPAGGRDPGAGGGPLVYMTGPFTGTAIPTSGRHAVAGRSPLTGIWAESDVGGSWGAALAGAGYDGLLIRGRASAPVYLWVHEEGAELRDASGLWGMDTFKVETALRDLTGQDASVSCIGPAGEAGVRFASIMHDGPSARAAGRCGLGALMGMKNLKAVAVRGRRRPPLARPEELRELIRRLAPGMRRAAGELHDYGTAGSMEQLDVIGDMPVRNWLGDGWEEGAENLSGRRMRERFFTRHYACRTCPIACGKEISVPGGRYGGPVQGAAPEYETLGCLGSLCMIDDLEAVAAANQLCNRLGMDTISTGAVIAFAMEARERGLLAHPDLDRLDLRWGNARSMVETVRLIGERRGVGELLGEGVREVARRVGGGDFAVQVKGLEPPAHDPRAFFSLALGYATSNRGACHLQAYSHPLEGWIALPELGYPESMEPHTGVGKALMVARLQNLMCVYDALKMCKFTLFAGVGPGHLAELLGAVTGGDWGVQDLLSAGERMFNLKRLYNVRLGIGRKDDTLPRRLRAVARARTLAAGCLPDLEPMLEQYYRVRGWNGDGAPLPGTLARLGLDTP